ncbi:hypothetical protein ACL1FZ_10500 [Corynebacterium striatum]
MIYICSPYSGDTEANVELVRQFCGFAVSSGKIPFAPHLLFSQFMDDVDSDQRELAMFSTECCSLDAKRCVLATNVNALTD